MVNHYICRDSVHVVHTFAYAWQCHIHRFLSACAFDQSKISLAKKYKKITGPQVYSKRVKLKIMKQKCGNMAMKYKK